MDKAVEKNTTGAANDKAYVAQWLGHSVWLGDAPQSKTMLQWARVRRGARLRERLLERFGE